LARPDHGNIFHARGLRRIPYSAEYSALKRSLKYGLRHTVDSDGGDFPNLDMETTTMKLQKMKPPLLSISTTAPTVEAA